MATFEPNADTTAEQSIDQNAEQSTVPSPLARVDEQGPAWSYQGYNDEDPNDDAVSWTSELPVPGFEWSAKSLVTVERVTDPLGADVDVGYYVGIYPFDEDGEGRGLVQDRYSLGPYTQKHNAVTNALAYMEKTVVADPGDEIVIDGDKIRFPEKSDGE